MTSKTYFDNVASDWDAMQDGFFSDEVRQKAYQVAGIKAGDVAADIGAGSGFVTQGLLMRGLRVIAVDQSQAMLDVMVNKFSGYGGQLDCRQGDSATLPIPDGLVQYTFANMYLHHVEEPLSAIREMVRILKPGGRLVLTDLDEHTHSFLEAEHHDRWPGFQREAVAGWLAEAGLRHVTVEDSEEKCSSSSEAGDMSASISIWIAAGVKLAT